MNNIEIANETIKITADKEYTFSGQTVKLPQADYYNVVVYTPEMAAELISRDFSSSFGEKLCEITVTAEDSFQAAKRFDKALVLNFASAHHAGGGFLRGARAQEESLCRCSTLYASISSHKAREMYNFNNSHPNALDSDYMLLSPEVCVFRDEKCQLLEEPFVTSVITAPAPNRRGMAALTPEKEIEATMLHRIRLLLRIAVEGGYRSLILGAWGCGAFLNKPENIARYFRTVIIDEGYGRCFDNICFAVYCSRETKNYTTFKDILL